MKVTLEDIRDLIAVQLGFKGKIEDQDLIVDDLGAESADVVNIIAAIEDKYGIVIEDSEIPDILRVEDLYAFIRDRVKKE